MTIIWTKEDYIPFAASANYSQHNRLNHFSMTSINLLFIHFFLIVFISAAWGNDIRYKPTYNTLMLNLMIPQPSMNCKNLFWPIKEESYFCTFFYRRKKIPCYKFLFVTLTRHEVFVVISVKFKIHTSGFGKRIGFLEAITHCKIWSWKEPT